ncbi:GntR family transcriptional regulator [Rhodococcus sp. AD45]|uniref:GntR family transcriptional regulator n=1 Tax=Rhodococcus sp. (strain AD45) TaxID=103808 RepID=UPI0005D3FBFE|nr:GntR family transcriptional regulator [Rhodococcus sp. AD45]KJF19153.1 putative HTH-type transcriptional regulator [Rhodococcus sp. AD45]
MTGLPLPPSRTEQVYDAILDEICRGKLPPGVTLRQELLAEHFQVSRQPIQQALLLLKSHGLVRDSGKRGLEVVPLDEKFVVDLYEMRAVVDGLAARRAASRITPSIQRRSEELLREGALGVQEGSFAHMIAADMEFHQHLLQVADNMLLSESAAVLYRSVRRVMGEVLRQSGTPHWVWAEHEGIHAAIVRGDADLAETLAREHAIHGTQLILGAMFGDSTHVQTAVDA